MFKLEWVRDTRDKTLGVFLRVFGIDLTVLLAAKWIDWRIIDLRIPHNYGLYLQIWFILLSVGRLDSSVYDALKMEKLNGSNNQD